MAAPAKALFDLSTNARDPLLEAAATEGPLAALARLHEEAQETARLAALPGQALKLAVALPLLAGATVLAAAGGAAVPSTIAWALLITIASIALVRIYVHAIKRPLEHAVLRAFAQDLHACLLYAGFAWGAGAFLVLGSGTSPVAALVFAAAPAAVLAGLSRDRTAALLFVAPVAALTALACVLRPSTPGALAATIMLIACAAAASGAVSAARYVAMRREGGLPQGVTAF